MMSESSCYVARIEAAPTVLPELIEEDKVLWHHTRCEVWRELSVSLQGLSAGYFMNTVNEPPWCLERQGNRVKLPNRVLC